jgi:2-polyprenyl-6-methoxyphenol hydroxylase-like FAD-dependent oxidoreductase
VSDASREVAGAGASSSALPVLIAGAGPTGLTLAIELARRGIAFRLVDRVTARSDKSRALAVQARTLELLRGIGVADQLVARGRKTLDISFAVDKRQVARVQLGDIGVDDTPYPFVLFASQCETEELLDAALAKFGARFEPGVELTSATQDDGGVTATLTHINDGRVETLRCAWLVGCDGAHSVVRKAAGLGFEGAQYEQQFMLADVKLEWQAPGDLLFLFGHKRTVVVFPLPGGWSRITAVRADDAPISDDEPTLDEAQSFFDSVSPWPARLYDPRWMTRYRLHHRGVDRYRSGRMLVAGDAAHIHSPAGGQGMNTGIQDAINLGWKLARVVDGRSPPSLIDSYDEERRPVGQRLLSTTDRIFEIANAKNSIVAWARNKIVPLAVPRLMATPARRRLLFRFVSELAIDYRGSAAVLPGCGQRAPDAIIGGGGVVGGAARHLHDAFASTYHHLVTFSDDGDRFARAAAARFGGELDCVRGDGAEAEQRYGVARGWVLVRPDGYIAARAHALDDGALESYFARIGASASSNSSKRPM